MFQKAMSLSSSLYSSVSSLRALIGCSERKPAANPLGTTVNNTPTIYTKDLESSYSIAIRSLHILPYALTGETTNEMNTVGLASRGGIH